MIFFAVLIRSSSPKLNFFINTPAATATAAAGVANFNSQSSIFSKAEFSLSTKAGVPSKRPAWTVVGIDRIKKRINKTTKRYFENVIKWNVFLENIVKPP